MIGSQLNHYKILDKLGTGGMGEVYAAEDTKLNRKVAIKILPEDLATDPERRERFEREAKTIAALNHPNIVTIYSVEESEGLHFITMELVEGTPLGDQIPEQGLTLEEFFKLSVPMAEALDAAHKRGITHRDIKPSNVMVTDEGRVKVLDFGLAKLTGKESPLDPAEAATMMASSDLTEQGQILGTVNYMSPEQAEGKVIDHRSDIFSLGVVMYEMATGEAPFKGDTKISVITSIMRDTPPPVSEINHDLPQHLGRVVNRSLAKLPDRRYQSASDLCNELEDLKEEIATSELRHSAMNLKPAPASSGNGLKYAAIAAAAVVAVAGLGYFLLPRLGGGPAAPTAPVAAIADTKPSLAVLYFENLSGDENLNWLRTGLTDMLVTDLAQSPNIRVLGTDRLHQILEDIGAADDEMTSSNVVEAVAEQGNVENVLLGSFARAGNMIRISARLQVAATGEILLSETVEGEGEESIFQLVDDLTKRIKADFDMADEMMVADIDADLSDVTTESVEAYRYYVEGIMLHEQLREDEAIPLLEKAVEIDPDFAMAIAKLATSYNNIGDSEKSLEYSQRAMEHLDRVTDRERYYIEGRHYSLDEDTIDQSIAAYQKAVELYPDHTAARNNLAQQLLNQERFAEAIDHLEELRSNKMQFPGTYASLATAYGMTGRLDEGLGVLRQYVRENPDNAAGYENLAEHLAWADRGDEAMDAAMRAERLGRPGGLLRWQILMLENDREQAADVLEALAEDDDERVRANALLAGAMMELFDGDADAALADLEEFAGLDDAVLVQGLNMRSALQLDLGDLDGAEETAARMVDGAGENALARINGLAVRATVFAARGQMESAEEVTTEIFSVVAQMPMQDFVIEREEQSFRGRAAFVAGDWSAAIQFLEAAFEGMPPREQLGNSQRTGLHYALGAAYYETGNLEAAEDNFLNALEMPGRIYDPVPTVRSLWYLGRIYEERGDDRRATEYYRRFIDFWGAGDIDEDRVEHAEDFLDALG